MAIKDIDLTGWFPECVTVDYGDVFTLSGEELEQRFAGYDALVYAVGPDDRVVPKAPAYEFFHERLVVACEKTVVSARKAGVKRCVILNSYFAFFDRQWPQKQLAEHHPYIKCRVEQAQRAIAAGGDTMAVMILELPYIFGAMPKRTPIWKDVFLEKYAKGHVIFFPKGGTSMIAVQHVGEAVIGALENGEHGKRYPIGDENHTYNEMLEMMMDALGRRATVINIPRFLAVLAGGFIERGWRKKGLQSGLDPTYLMRDILTDYLYFDASESAEALGFDRGGLKEAITDTMKACYPERFRDAQSIEMAAETS
jgi:nucleoside-diphosphate-sugar epimerase